MNTPNAVRQYPRNEPCPICKQNAHMHLLNDDPGYYRIEDCQCVRYELEDIFRTIFPTLKYQHERDMLPHLPADLRNMTV